MTDNEVRGLLEQTFRLPGNHLERLAKEAALRHMALADFVGEWMRQSITLAELEEEMSA